LFEAAARKSDTQHGWIYLICHCPDEYSAKPKTPDLASTPRPGLFAEWAVEALKIVPASIPMLGARVHHLALAYAARSDRAIPAIPAQHIAASGLPQTPFESTSSDVL